MQATPITGTIVQAVAALFSWVVPAGGYWPPVVAGFLGAVGVAVGSLCGFRSPLERVLGVAVGAVSVLSWVSWIVVGTMHRPGDPVINIVGILIAPLSLAAVVNVCASLLPRARATHG